MNREEINALKSIYKILFESGEALQEKAQSLLENENSESIKNLLEFITTSKRGIPFIRKNING